MKQRDRYIVRELAKRYMEMATSEKQQKMNKRMLDTFFEPFFRVTMAGWIDHTYVYARKPTLANVAMVTDVDIIRKETEKTVTLASSAVVPL